MIQEAWIAGVSTRRVDDLVQAMGLSGISKSSVSKLCKEIVLRQAQDEGAGARLPQPPAIGRVAPSLARRHLPKARAGGRTVSVAAIVAVAVDTEGCREIVGPHIGPGEAEVFWTDLPHATWPSAGCLACNSSSWTPTRG